MGKKRPITRSIIILGIIALFAGVLFTSVIEDEWRVAEDGSLEYPPSASEYSLISSKTESGSNLYEVSFSSPEAQWPEGVPGVVLLSGATITKE